MAASRKVAQAAASGWGESLRKLFFNTSGYRKYGLLYHDCLHETPAVEEAIRRLPDSVKDERTFRIIRAHQLALMHNYLPKEQWTPYEKDYRYLKPYLDEVERELAERAEWDKK